MFPSNGQRTFVVVSMSIVCHFCDLLRFLVLLLSIGSRMSVVVSWALLYRHRRSYANFVPFALSTFSSLEWTAHVRRRVRMSIVCHVCGIFFFSTCFTQVDCALSLLCWRHKCATFVFRPVYFFFSSGSRALVATRTATTCHFRAICFFFTVAPPAFVPGRGRRLLQPPSIQASL